MAQANIEESVDRISSLPDSILAHILSFLPTNVAVSTCILLTRSRWRDIFPFSNNLDFDESFVHNPNGTSLFKDFVDRCITLKNRTPIDKFRLKCSNAVETSRIYSWICSALCSNARELDLCMGTRHLANEYPLIFTCTTLVVLKLQGNGLSLNVPASVSLPCLKTLHLESIKLSRYEESPIQRLVSSSPVLEDLLLVRCCMKDVYKLSFSSPSLKRLAIDKHKPSRSPYCEYELVLVTPSLEYLRFALCVGQDHMLKNLGSLREAHVDISYWCEGGSGHHELLEGLGDIQSLYIYLSGKVGKFLRTTLDAFQELPLLENLTRLVLSDKPYLEMSVVMKFLQCCPNLEEFVTDGGIHGGYDVPFCVPSRLKSIECAMFYDGGATHHEGVESLEYFLKNADMLERIRIHFWWYFWLSHREVDEKSKAVKETLEKLGRDPSRSKTCEINVFLTSTRRKRVFSR